MSILKRLDRVCHNHLKIFRTSKRFMLKELDKKLLAASEKGSVDEIQNLLKDGANINAIDEYGVSAIHLATQGNKIEAVQELLSQKANIDSITTDGLTALHFAARKGYLEISVILLKNGANSNIKGFRYGRTPLHYAAEQGHSKVVLSLLMAGSDKDLLDLVGNKACDLANKNAYFSTSNLLI